MATTTVDWMTNFYYGQELRSLYMNGLLNSGFKPGIYNASMYLFIRNAGESALPDGVYLHVKRGTTLVFTNRYNYVNDRYERDINTAGSYVIKSTAFTDIDIPLITLSGAGGGNEDAINILGGGEASKCAKKFYIIAAMAYNPDEDLKYQTPTILPVIDNASFRINDLSESGINDDDKLNFYFTIPRKSFAQYNIPDGSHTYNGNDSDKMLEFGYLTLGCVLDFAKEGVGGFNGYYTSNGATWLTSTTEFDPCDIWMKNHVFTGRGFPDYRQNYVDSKSELYPDLIPNLTLSEFYFDIPSLVTKNILYQNNLDWKGCYEYGYSAEQDRSIYYIDNAERTRKSCYKLDYRVYNSNVSPASPSKSEIDYEDSPYDMIRDINERGLTFTKNISRVDGYDISQEEVLVVDLVFLSTRQSYSAETSATTEEIENIFLSEKANNELLVSGIRWYSSTDFQYINPLDSMIDYSGNSVIESLIPLDIGEDNIDRLKGLLYNRNIIPQIADYMRKHYDESPYLNPQESTDLIPACIMFRKFRVVRNEAGEVTALEIPSDSSEEVSLPTSTSGSSVTAGRVHPANILSFFDLQFKTNAVTAVHITQPDTFNVLPVIR